MRTTLSVLDLWDVIRSRRAEYEELADNVALLNEQVLRRVCPDAETDEAAARLADALGKAADEVDAFLRQQKHPLKRLIVAFKTFAKLHTRMMTRCLGVKQRPEPITRRPQGSESERERCPIEDRAQTAGNKLP